MTKKADTVLRSYSFLIGRPGNRRKVCVEIWRNRSLLDNDTLLEILCKYYETLFSLALTDNFDVSGEAAFLHNAEYNIVIGVIAELAQTEAAFVIKATDNNSLAISAQRALSEESTNMFFLKVLIPDPRRYLSAGELLAASEGQEGHLKVSLQKIKLLSVLTESASTVIAFMAGKYLSSPELQGKGEAASLLVEKEMPSVTVYAKRRSTDVFCTPNSKNTIAQHKLREVWVSEGYLRGAEVKLKMAQAKLAEVALVAQRAVYAGGDPRAHAEVKRISAELEDIEEKLIRVSNEAANIEWEP